MAESEKLSARSRKKDMLDFRALSPRSGKSAGYFPVQRLVIEPRRRRASCTTRSEQISYLDVLGDVICLVKTHPQCIVDEVIK